MISVAGRLGSEMPQGNIGNPFLVTQLHRVGNTCKLAWAERQNSAASRAKRLPQIFYILAACSSIIECLILILIQVRVKPLSRKGLFFNSISNDVNFQAWSALRHGWRLGWT